MNPETGFQISEDTERYFVIFLRKILSLIAIALICSSCGVNDPMKVVVSTKTAADIEMDNAVAQAQASLTNFIATLQSPKPNQDGFAVSAKFTSEEKKVHEYIWISKLTYSSNAFHGIVATTEKTVVGLIFKQPVDVPTSNVFDWMYVEDGKVVGGFTGHLVRSRMTEAQRKSYDERMPFRYQ